MPNIWDVAREAGVGIGTVSRVLNASPAVADATRRRVLAAIERLGYTPSPVARAFGRRRTDTFDLVVPLFAQSFVVEILRGIEDGLADTGYTLQVRTVADATERDRAYEDCCRRGRSDGVFLVWIPPTEAVVERLSADRFPAVLLNGDQPRLSRLQVDHTASASSAVVYCAGIGHRLIALVDRAGDPFDPTSPGLCIDGYLAGMRAADLAVHDGFMARAELGASGGAQALEALSALEPRPTAVVAATESQALGVMQAARDHGWRVPGDLSVVGYNDNDLARDLGLTTIRVPLQEMGRQAAEILLALVNDAPEAPIVREIATELVVRRTCGPPT